MLWILTPHLHMASVLELDGRRLQALGLKGLLVDVDCTLKDYYSERFPSEVAAWVASLRGDGIRLCLVSNAQERRIAPLAEALGIPFVARAFKPFPFGCRTALRLLDLAPTQVAMVGDQLFADILAGRLAGIRTILVTPTSPEEPWFTRLKRPLERQVLALIGSRALPPPRSTLYSETD
jgi:uncharacterized protein